MDSLIIISSLFLIGVLINKTGFISTRVPLLLNQYVINIALPALVLKTLPSIEIDNGIWKIVTIAWFSQILALVLVFYVAKKFRFSRAVTGVLLLLVPFGNTSFVGIPMVTLLVGTSGLPAVIIYDQLGSFLGMILIGTTVLAIYSGSEKLTVAIFLKKVFSFPPFWALFLALLMPQIGRENILELPLNVLSSSLIPVVMLALGMQFEWRIPPHYLKPLASGLILKLLFIPFLIWSSIQLTGWQSLNVKVSLLEVAMAPMISAAALAIAANLAPKLAAALTSWGLIISFVTVPLWYQWIF